MEGMIGEIRMFGGDVAPHNWEFCRGQTLYISENDSLFSIIGPTYGGDGIETFMLPNLGGKVAIGVGQGNGLTHRALGETLGSEYVLLEQDHLPPHVHNSTLTFDTTPASATIQLHGVNDVGGESGPEGNYIGKDTGGGCTPYTSNDTNLVRMHARSIICESLYATMPEVRVSRAGKDSTHTNMQPVLAVNFIICINGVYPSNE
jgi:microcystin-dependent protein